MTKLNVRYNGFSLGFRVADRLALDYKPGNVLQSYMLHSVKNLVHVHNLTREIEACCINNVMYAKAFTK